MAKKKMPGFSAQGGAPSKANTASPRSGHHPHAAPAPMSGSSFRGKKPGATGSNDSKKAK